MRFVDWFAGIGGFRLGLESAGPFRCVAYSEVDPFACSVYEKHWPATPNLGDVNHVRPESIPAAELWTGGFPCQPFSVAGSKLGDKDPRNLWPAWFRLIREVRPRFLFMENVPGLLADRVILGILGDLTSAGYDAEWSVIGADDVGAPHRRKRLWIVAVSDSIGDILRDEPRRRNGARRSHPGIPRNDGASEFVAPNSRAGRGTPRTLERVEEHPELSSGSRNTPNSRANPGISLTDAVRGDGGEGRSRIGNATPRKWPTIQARDRHSLAKCRRGANSPGGTPLPVAVADSAAEPGPLHPCWVEWLMGFPIGFTASDASETPSSPKSSNG